MPPIIKKALIDHDFADKKNSVFRKKFEKRSSFFWYARLDSNQRPLESESNALSN